MGRSNTVDSIVRMITLPNSEVRVELWLIDLIPTKVENVESKQSSKSEVIRQTVDDMSYLELINPDAYICLGLQNCPHPCLVFLRK